MSKNNALAPEEQVLDGLPVIPEKSCLSCAARGVPEAIKSGTATEAQVGRLSVETKQNMEECQLKIALGACSLYPPDHFVAARFENSSSSDS